MARMLVPLAGLVTASLLLAPPGQAYPLIPPVEDILHVVFHHAGDHIVVDGPCPAAEACVPDYCIPPLAECNPLPIPDIIGDLLS